MVLLVALEPSLPSVVPWSLDREVWCLRNDACRPIRTNDCSTCWGAAGAAIGIGLSFAYGAQALSVGFFIATLGVTGFFGLVAPLPLITRLNNEYMERAILCYESGDYQGAYEDASEVARSCERFRAQAQEIADAASQAKRDAHFGGTPGGMATAQPYAV